MSAAVPYRARLVTMALLFDCVGTVVALVGSAWEFSATGDWPEGKSYLSLLILALIPTQVLVFHLIGAYSSLRRNDLADWIRTGLSGLALLVAMFAVAVFLLKAGELFSRAAIIGWIGFGALGIIASRLLAYTLVQRRLAIGDSGERTLLIGEADACAAMGKHLLSHQTLGLLPVASLPVSAGHSAPTDFEAMLDRLGVTQVLICGRFDCHGLVAEILRRLERTSVEVHYAPHLADLPAFCLRAGELAGRPVFHLATSPFGQTAVTIKWCEDFFGGILMLICAAPVMLVAAIAVKLTSPGPILFRQQRHGLGGRVIYVYKFRSMYAAEPASSALVPAFNISSPEATAHRISARLLMLSRQTPITPRSQGDAQPEDFIQATHRDPRITWVGRWLRATSIDELPQLFNVLKGEMSLVGPRPHALRHNHQFAVEVREMMRRHYVKPGITGLAQISGARGETRTVEDMRRRVELDLEYIRTWSVWLDLRILFITPIVGLFNRQP